MGHSKLIFWDDKEACARFFMDRDNKSREDVEHSVKLAMEYGAVVGFSKEADLKAFKGSKGIRSR